MLNPEEIDPETLRITADLDLKSQLEGMAQLAKFKAMREGSYVFLYHELADDGSDGMQLKAMEPFIFEEGFIQCPRAADLEYEIQFNNPRPLPSMLATPTGELHVSKPSLCDMCEHRLHRSVTSNCDGLTFKRLERI